MRDIFGGSPWVPALLSLAVPGAGQATCLRIVRGLIFFALTQVGFFSFLALACWTLLHAPSASSYLRVLSCGAILAVLWIANGLDAYFLALGIRRRKIPASLGEADLRFLRWTGRVPFVGIIIPQQLLISGKEQPGPLTNHLTEGGER
ncbi:MAG: hypothetical protein HYU64_20150 [Armatimonadetes bacterium]|nr:hypothetical protein [Armatimonadota bacterium]